MLAPAGRHRKLNDLLRDIPANRHQIFLALYELALCRSASLRFQRRQDREDAISEAVVHAMTHLHSYQPERRAAVAYFGRVVRRAMRRWLRHENRYAHHHDAVRERRADASLLDQGVDVPRRRRRPASKELPPLHDPLDRRRATTVLDGALEAALATQENKPGEPIAEKAAVAVGVLQQIRKRLLGRYNRICSDHERLQDQPGG